MVPGDDDLEEELAEHADGQAPQGDTMEGLIRQQSTTS